MGCRKRSWPNLSHYIRVLLACLKKAKQSPHFPADIRTHDLTDTESYSLNGDICSVHVVFVVDKVALGKIFSRVLRGFPCQDHFITAPYIRFTHLPRKVYSIRRWDSVQQLATSWRVRGSNPLWGQDVYSLPHPS
jgi:hypothetical protein